MSSDHFSWNPPKQHVSDPETQLCSAIFQLWSLESHSNSTSHRALGRYRHTSSSRQFCNILCWLEIQTYCPDFNCSISFLKATSLICESQLSFAAHQKHILWFFSWWWMIKGIWALFSLLFIFLWNRKPWLDHFMSIVTLECSKLWIWMGIYCRDIKKFLGVPIIVSNLDLTAFYDHICQECRYFWPWVHFIIFVYFLFIKGSSI